MLDIEGLATDTVRREVAQGPVVPEAQSIAKLRLVQVEAKLHHWQGSEPA